MIQQSKMIQSLNYILTIAGAERVMLYRTAKFWVLGGIGALMVVFFYGRDDRCHDC